jgi:hypothetical protein
VSLTGEDQKRLAARVPRDRPRRSRGHAARLRRRALRAHAQRAAAPWPRGPRSCPRRRAGRTLAVAVPDSHADVRGGSGAAARAARQRRIETRSTIAPLIAMGQRRRRWPSRPASPSAPSGSSVPASTRPRPTLRGSLRRCWAARTRGAGGRHLGHRAGRARRLPRPDHARRR